MLQDKKFGLVQKIENCIAFYFQGEYVVVISLHYRSRLTNRNASCSDVTMSQMSGRSNPLTNEYTYKYMHVTTQVVMFCPKANGYGLQNMVVWVDIKFWSG